VLEYLKIYKPTGIRLVYGNKQYVWDDNGKRYLDYHTGFGVAFLGHRPRRVVERLKRQLERLMVATPSFENDVRDEMLNLLGKIIPQRYRYIVLQNSGTEAVEVALKIARKATGRSKIVSFIGSFHGRTYGSLSVTWNPNYREPFKPLLPNVTFLPWNKIEHLERGIDEDTAAVILELIQGEGGVNPASLEFVKALYDEVKRKNCLLIVDEVQTGFGRTGSIWAFQQYNVEPDIFTAGKAIGGGFPVGLVVVRDGLGDVLKPGEHGSTFGGNPLACAAIVGSIETLLEDDVADKARVKGERLRRLLEEELGELRIVRRVKGLGLMLGVELRKQPISVILELQKLGLLASKAGATTVRLLPPYLISDDDISWSIEVLKNAISKCYS